jgi:hypothetical protein
MMLQDEYAVSGWYKFSPPQQVWHGVFRLTMNNKPDNRDASRLGDRDLVVFLHNSNQYFPVTYSYGNMYMGGDSNRYVSIPHGNQVTQWHYIYFGYSRQARRAYFYC